MAIHAVYSTCFLQVGITPSIQTYNVPPGFTAILHDMVTFFNAESPGGDAGTDGIHVELDIPSITVWHIRGLEVHNGTYHWQGRQVFTNELILYGGGIGGSFRACGYLLQDPP